MTFLGTNELVVQLLRFALLGVSLGVFYRFFGAVIAAFTFFLRFPYRAAFFSFCRKERKRELLFRYCSERKMPFTAVFRDVVFSILAAVILFFGFYLATDLVFRPILLIPCGLTFFGILALKSGKTERFASSRAKRIREILFLSSWILLFPFTSVLLTFSRRVVKPFLVILDKRIKHRLFVGIEKRDLQMISQNIEKIIINGVSSD